MYPANSNLFEQTKLVSIYLRRQTIFYQRITKEIGSGKSKNNLGP